MKRIALALWFILPIFACRGADTVGVELANHTLTVLIVIDTSKQSVDPRLKLNDAQLAEMETMTGMSRAITALQYSVNARQRGTKALEADAAREMTAAATKLAVLKAAMPVTLDAANARAAEVRQTNAALKVDAVPAPSPAVRVKTP